MSEHVNMDSQNTELKVYKYACIYWPEENMYSCVKAEKIAFSILDYPTQESMIDKTFSVVWESTGDEYTGTIKGFGPKGKMGTLALDLAAEAREQSLLIFEEQTQQGRTRSDRNNLLYSQTANRAESQLIAGASSSTTKMLKQLEVNSAAMQVISTLKNGEESESGAVETEKDIIIVELKKQLQKEKNKVYKLKRSVLKTADDDEKIDLGDGITAAKSVVLNIRDRYRHSPSQFLRSLMEDTGLFTLDEIASCSVKGKSSPMSRNITRPGLSPLFYTLKRYTINECGLIPGTLEMLTFEKSTNSICCDARKRLKSKKQILDFNAVAE